MIYTTHSDRETQELAVKLAKKFRTQGGVIALQGDLGAGKTTFVQGFAKGLGIKNKILSPTFVIIRQYQLPKEERLLVHADLYRLRRDLKLSDVGLLDYLHHPNNIIVIEWPEKLASLPENCLSIIINKISDHDREIKIDG